jgi:hypothetical protein
MTMKTMKTMAKQTDDHHNEDDEYNIRDDDDNDDVDGDDTGKIVEHTTRH